MAKLYAVALPDAERLLLQQTIKKGKASARTTTRARILLSDWLTSWRSIRRRSTGVG